MRMIAKFHKDSSICEISHLDIMRSVQRALRRSQLPVQYSAGFNPHQNIAFASALSVGIASSSEWMDVSLIEKTSEIAFFAALAPHMPLGMMLEECHAVDDQFPALMSITAWAEYQLELAIFDVIARENMLERMNKALQMPLLAEKKGKAGIKTIDLRPMIDEISLRDLQHDGSVTNAKIFLRCVHAPSGALNPLLLLPVWLKACDLEADYQITRTAILAEKSGQNIPLWSVNGVNLEEHFKND